MKKKLVLVAALASLVWNIYLMAAVALNDTSVAKRVAGGQLHTFGTMLRFTYTVQGLLMIFQFLFLIQLFKRGGVWSKTTYLWARIFMILSFLSAVVNMASRSTIERWNVIPALLIGIAYLVLGGLNFRPRRR